MALVPDKKDNIPCKYIFRRGKKRDTSCGQKCKNGEFCTTHAKAVLQVQKFPGLVMETIVNAVTDSCSLKIFHRLLNMRQTCTEFRDLVDERFTSLYHELFVATGNVHATEERHLAGLSAKQKLHLLLESGCQRCKHPRVTKVHWPFPFRACTSCIDEIMIRDYVLARFKIPEELIPDRYLVRETWTRFQGMDYYKLYLIHDVEKALGQTLDEYKEQKEKRSKEHKEKLVVEIGQPWDTVYRLSHTFRYEDYPDAAVVEKVVYTELAKQSFRSNRYWSNHFDDEKERRELVKDKISYEVWAAWLVENADLIKTKLIRQEYDTLKQYKTYDLVQKLRTLPYFKTTDLSVVLPDFMTRTWENDTVERLAGDMKKYGCRIKKFVEMNGLDPKGKAFMFDETSIRVANNLLRYPDTGPMPVSKISDFVHQYLTREQIIDVVPARILQIQTWTDAITFLKKTKTRHYKRIFPGKMVVFF